MVIGAAKYNNKLTFFRTLRLSFVDKLNLRNTYAITGVTAAVHIDLKNLEDFDSTRLIAAVFAIRLLTGSKPYVSRFGLFQTFKEKDYDASVRVDVRGSGVFALLEVLAYEILPFVAKADCLADALENKKGIVVLLAISDLSFIRVVETHSIFFKWHDTVKIRLQFPVGTLAHISTYLSAFKLN